MCFTVEHLALARIRLRLRRSAAQAEQFVQRTIASIKLGQVGVVAGCLTLATATTIATAAVVASLVVVIGIAATVVADFAISVEQAGK